MADKSETSRDDADPRSMGAAAKTLEIRAWFAREVLPLEAALMQFLQRNWRNPSDIADLRQDVYVRVFEAARKQIPDRPRHFVFMTARNLLIDRVRREHVVLIDAVSDLDALGFAMEAPAPDRNVIAREELRRLQAALDRLPPRCREAVILGRVEGLNGREIAQRMNISEAAVSKHLDAGMRAIADMIYGEQADLRRRV